MKARHSLIVLLTAIAIFATLDAGAIECFTPEPWQPRLDNTPLDLDGNFIDDAIDALPPTDIVDVIVALNRCPEAADRLRLAQFATLDHVSKYVSYAVLTGIPVNSIYTLVHDEIVAFVEHDRAVLPTLDVSNPAIRVRTSTQYAPNTVEDAYSTLDGTNVTIAIIDSGVDDMDGTHPGNKHESFPLGKFAGGAECLSNPCVELNPNDLLGHGTHVAGIALGTGGVGATYQGVAPDARLVDIKVFGTGSSSTAVILRGMEKVLERQSAWGIDIVNMSLSDCSNSNGTDSKSVLANRMVFEGLFVVASMGNKDTSSEGCNDEDNMGMPVQRVPSPAAADDVITVANADDLGTILRIDPMSPGDDVINPDSLRGPRGSDGDLDTADEQKPDLAAHGTTINAPEYDTTQMYQPLSGTSMSAPHVAGCAARILEADPTIRPLSLKQLLLDYSQDYPPAGWDSAWGRGLLDCFASVDQLQQTAGTDLGFNVYVCKSGYNPPCWLSPEIYPTNPSIREGVQNTVNVEVSNLGANPVSNYSVNIGVYDFGNGDSDYHICTVQATQPLPAGQTATFSCNWTPGVSGTPPGSVHACLKGEVIYSFDSNYGNQRVQRNIRIVQTQSPAFFPTSVSNPTDEELTMELRPVRCLCNDEEGPCPCPGWDFRVAPDFPMAPDDCPRIEVLELEPLAPDAPRRAQVDVGVIGHPVVGPEQELFGVSVLGEIGCATSNLIFQNKQSFSWVAAPFFECPPVFDVIRGPLPIQAHPVLAGGDFTAAACFENDDNDLQAFDADPLPAGAGFYYLSRAGGALPGTWDSGTEVGSRGPTLLGCP